MNSQYGFKFSLPQDWSGYSIIMSTWDGYSIAARGDVPTEHGPLISIRNPKWTAQKPSQDIPIMVFTLTQWDALLRGEFHIGAAPINPTRLGYNAQYVFALPARYNYAFPSGYEEVDAILQGRPLEPLPLMTAMSDNGKILLCGGIPNGSTQEVPETTRLFINLPKDVYPDKEHNLRFKTINGNATAGWVSNAGPYGEAFPAHENPGCWSYYYEFDGHGEIDLTVEPDYSVRFIVGPAQQP